MNALLLVAAAIAINLLPLIVNAQSNLPDVHPGIFNVSTRIIINAPLPAVRDVLLDFPAYPVWNPFIRFQTITDDHWVPLPDQTLQENLRTIVQAKLHLSSNKTRTIVSYDNITHVDLKHNRWAWRPMAMGKRPPPPGRSDIVVRSLHAEKWTALSIVPCDTDEHRHETLYESRTVYHGPVAYIVRKLYGPALQEGYDSMAHALKKRVEELDPSLVVQSL